MRWIRLVICTAVAGLVWLGSLHCWFERTPDVLAAPLAARQLALWEGEPDLTQLRRTNPEWDLMARMFAVLAFANLALEGPRARYLATIDRIIARTEAELERGGAHRFLLPYGHLPHFQRSLFVDGELAMMLAARLMVEREPRRAARARALADAIVAQVERGPRLLAASYPDEAWTFCHSVALAAVRLIDMVDGERDRHAGLFRRWVEAAILDPATGLLVSKTTLDGRPLDGPEGSTLWLSATMLRLVDDDFARGQYERARRELRGELAGFGWAREWPASWANVVDVDSGPTIPLVGANAGSSGLALVAARAFDDDAFARELVASLGLAGFPRDGGFAAGNQLADAVILFATSGGALWHRAGVPAVTKDGPVWRGDAR